MIVREETVYAQAENEEEAPARIEVNESGKPGGTSMIDELQEEAGFWRAKYQEERARLAKLWVAYQDLESDFETQGRELEALRDAPAPSLEPTERPIVRLPVQFHFGEFGLFERKVDMKNGGQRIIHFFARKKPKSGTPAVFPAGFEVQESRTGLPFLRRIGNHPEVEKAPQYRPQCVAFAHGGDQCRNSARGGSRYCSAHVGYHPPSATGFLRRLDTKPRNGASDTHLTSDGATHVTALPDAKRSESAGTAMADALRQLQCAGFTDEGAQCRNLAREGSKYCSTHRGFHPPTLEGLVKAHDTRPRVRGAKNTTPALRKSG